MHLQTARTVFNVYAVKWTPEEIRAYVNEQHYFTFRNERLTDPKPITSSGHSIGRFSCFSTSQWEGHGEEHGESIGRSGRSEWKSIMSEFTDGQAIVFKL